MSKGRWFLTASLAMVFLLVIGTTVFLYGQGEYEPPNRVAGTDAQRSQVYVTGTGYTVDQQREKIHQKEEKQKREEQAKKPEKEQQTAQKPKASARSSSAKTIRNRQASRSSTKKTKGKPTAGKKNGGGSSNGPAPTAPAKQETDPTKSDPGGGGGESEEDRAKKPVIRVSVASGERISGRMVDFTVSVTDYKGRNVPVFSEDDGSFTVTLNGTRLYSTGTSGSQTAFREAMAEGSNEIRVSAADREGNTSVKTVRFTGNTTEEAERTGGVSVSIEAPILHLEVIYATEVPLHRGDTAKDVLETAFREAGIKPTFSGSYLAGISRAGISQDAWVDDDVRALMEEMRKTEKDPEKQDRNQLKEHDFYDSSGWIYNVNGEFPEIGLGSYKMEDGDALYLIFQLAEDVY